MKENIVAAVIDVPDSAVKTHQILNEPLVMLAAPFLSQRRTPSKHAPACQIEAQLETAKPILLLEAIDSISFFLRKDWK
jgi:hypothetical protein